MRQGLATFLELALCIYKNYENFAEDVNSLASEMKNLIRTCAEHLRSWNRISFPANPIFSALMFRGFQPVSSDRNPD
jgi:hypothetical protein